MAHVAMSCVISSSLASQELYMVSSMLSISPEKPGQIPIFSNVSTMRSREYAFRGYTVGTANGH